MKCLVSDMSIYDKCTVLNEFLVVSSHKEWSRIAEPNSSRETRKSMKHSLLWFESKLDESGHFEIVQIIRFFIFGLLLKEKDEEGGKEKKNEEEIDDAGSKVHKWSRLVIRADAKARWIVQREIYLKEEIHALRKSLSH